MLPEQIECWLTGPVNARLSDKDYKLIHSFLHRPENRPTASQLSGRENDPLAKLRLIHDYNRDLRNQTSSGQMPEGENNDTSTVSLFTDKIGQGEKVGGAKSTHSFDFEKTWLPAHYLDAARELRELLINWPALVDNPYCPAEIGSFITTEIWKHKTFREFVITASDSDTPPTGMRFYTGLDPEDMPEEIKNKIGENISGMAFKELIKDRIYVFWLLRRFMDHLETSPNTQLWLYLKLIFNRLLDQPLFSARPAQTDVEKLMIADEVKANPEKKRIYILTGCNIDSTILDELVSATQRLLAWKLNSETDIKGKASDPIISESASQITLWEKFKKWALNNKLVVIFASIGIVAIFLVTLISNLKTLFEWIHGLIIWLWP
ncbi:MAG: hypothetical protein ABSE63_02685 [Thermoguttaceae bacterium]